MILLLWIFLCAQNTYCRYTWKVVHTNNQLTSLDPSDKAIDVDRPKAYHGKNPPEGEAEVTAAGGPEGGQLLSVRQGSPGSPAGRR